MDRINRAALLVVLGVALLTNGVWLYPNEVSDEERFVYETRETVNPLTHGLANCDFYPLYSQRCAVANYLADGNTIRYNISGDGSAVADRFEADYRYVEVYGNDWYRPTHSVENGSVVLGLEPVTRERALSNISDEWQDVRPFVRRAVENGTATTTDVYAGDPSSEIYVERNGSFYTVHYVGTERVPTGWGWKEPPGWVIVLLRTGGWVGGLTVLVGAGRVSAE